MARATGSEVIAAFKKAGTWGTPVVCGAGDGLLILPSTLKIARAIIDDNSLGRYWMQDQDSGSFKADGEIKSFFRYDGHDLLLAMAMGAAGAPTYTGGTGHNCDGAGSTTTAVKSTAGYTPDALIGKFYTITADSGNPTNVGQTRKITDNDATTLTWVGAIPFATSTTTQGTISDGVA